MLTYNRPQYLCRAIESVRGQVLQNWELLVIHDGSNDRTAEIMREQVRGDSRIRYFNRPKGGNIANATNYGLTRARGRYIAILDDDDFWASPAKLSKQVDFLDENPDYAACGGGMILVDGAGVEKQRCLKRQNDAELKRWALVANPIAHSTAMFRRSLIQKCGGYDESLSGFQDWDVFLKLGQLGKLYNFPEEFTCYTIWSARRIVCATTQQHLFCAHDREAAWRHLSGLSSCDFHGRFVLRLCALAALLPGTILLIPVPSEESPLFRPAPPAFRYRRSSCEGGNSTEFSPNVAPPRYQPDAKPRHRFFEGKSPTCSSGQGASRDCFVIAAPPRWHVVAFITLPPR